jgi:hypothetical protein
MPFNQYYDEGDKLDSDLKSELKQDMPVPMAPPCIQELFDDLLALIAKRTGHTSPVEYIAEVLDGVVYHFTLNFLAGHSVEHGDQFGGAAPGKWILNTALQQAGLFYVLDHKTREDGTRLPPSGVWQEEGDCVGFSGEARTYMLHGVLREMPIKPLPASAADMLADPAWRQTIRIVGTVRGGDPSVEEQKAWYIHHGADLNLSDPFKVLPKPESAKAPGKQPPVKPEGGKKKGAPRTSSRLAASTPAPCTSLIVMDAGGVVPADFAHLPKMGDVLNDGYNSTFATCTVVGLLQNFVLTNVMGHKSTMILEAGMKFKIRLPPLDDTVTEVLILAVGEVCTKKSNGHKYRAAVLRRKVVDAKDWGPCEMLEARGFPTKLNCEVKTHAHTH